MSFLRFYGAEQALIEASAYRRLIYNVVGDLHFGRRWRNRVMKAVLKKVQETPRRVLDAGCGLGQTMAALQRCYPQATINGCDIVAENVQKCSNLIGKARLRSEHIWVCDLEADAIEGRYDLVVCMEVLEHIEHWQSAVASMSEALVPGGYMLITTPSLSRYQQPDYGLRRYMAVSEDDREGKGQTHVRDGFDMAELKAGFKAQQMEVVFDAYAFGPAAMWWHTAFEHVRSRSMPLWLLVTLPAMCTTPLLERCFRSDGGSIVLLLQKNK